VIDAPRIRRRYQDQVGLVETERTVGTAEAPLVILEVRSAGTHAYSYATIGASEGPLAGEIVIDVVERSASFDAAIEAVAHTAPVVLAPGAVVPCVVPGTPFVGFLCLPIERGGSFSLGKADGPPHAYRLSPLTAAEKALAEREPARALELLCTACALTADPYRACLVDLPPPNPAAQTEVGMARRQARAAILALHASVLSAQGEKEPRLPPQLRRAGDGRRPYPGSHRALLAYVQEAIRVALAPYVRHPLAITRLFGELIHVTLATHPDAVRLLDRTLDPRNLPRPAAAVAAREAATASLHVVEALAIALSRHHPGESAEALLARGRREVPEALAGFDPGDEIPVENHVWATVLPALYEGLADLQAPAVRNMPAVFRHVAREEAMLEYEIDPRPPMVRVEAIAARLATELVTAYAAGLRGKLRA
jgi:hypothetical protein